MLKRLWSKSRIVQKRFKVYKCNGSTGCRHSVLGWNPVYRSKVKFINQGLPCFSYVTDSRRRTRFQLVLTLLEASYIRFEFSDVLQGRVYSQMLKTILCDSYKRMMTFMGLSKKLVHLSLRVVKKTRCPEKIIDQLLHSFLFPKLNINAAMAEVQM